jgi:gluconate 2-dehydrogenase gamma chain
MTFISRRDLLKRVGAAGVAASGLTRPAEAFALHRAVEEVTGQSQVVRREPLESLTAAEAATLDAIVARLIPTDALGPGAAEARAVRYIDRALGGALSGMRQDYTAGLSALDRYSRSSRGGVFAQLSPADQDSILGELEIGAASGFESSPVDFFNMVLTHTHQGTFGDPYYGGNADFVGWDLIQYPGIRTMVSPSDQKQLETNELKPNHKSAYDYESFVKASPKED